MYIYMHKYHFEIRLNKTHTPIYIESRNSDTYVLSVPMDLREDELKQYLKSNGKKLITVFEKKRISNQALSIELYNKKHIFVWKPNSSISYRYEGKIHSSILPKSTLSIKKICKDILYYDIKTLIGIWEERLTCIITDINLKNFKTNKFKICTRSNTLSFSFQLMDSPYYYVEFIVAKAVFQYLNIEETKQHLLMEEFVKDYKQSNKIYDYERSKSI